MAGLMAYGLSHSGFAAEAANALVAGTADAANPNDASSGASDANEAHFNASWLQDDTQGIDLSRFEHGNGVLPGTYEVDLHVNGNWIGRQSVAFRAIGTNDAVQPCFKLEELERFGVDVSKLAQTAAAHDACRPLEQWIAQASSNYDSAELNLELSIPQAWMRRNARDYVAPRYWDRGINAGFLNYHINTNQLHNSPPGSGRSSSQNTGYLGLTAGLNLFGWQLRQTSSTTWQSHQAARWQNINTYAQRSLPGLRSVLMLGDTNTSGELFDSVHFRGAQLAFDDRMLPNSLRGYAPAIHGIANTNARVEVRQNGTVIYQATVTPGPFVIDDLYPTGYGGNLDVTVTEADGTQNSFSVPYSSVVQLLRPGIYRYNVVAGRVHEYGLPSHPYLLQGSYQRGLSNQLTGYAGLSFIRGYRSALVGSALNTRLGALSLDVTQSWAEVSVAKQRSGRAIKLGYSKVATGTRTNVSVAAYRYSTSGYLSLRNVLAARDAIQRGKHNDYTARDRNRFDLTVSQPLGQGSLYVTASTNDYWGQTGRNLQYQLGYTNHVGPASYTVSAMRSRDSLGRNDNQVMLSLTLPLGRGSRAPLMTASASKNRLGDPAANVSVSGTAGKNNDLSYTLGFNRDTQGRNSGSVSGQYWSPYTTLGASYERGQGYQQTSFNAEGTMVLHSGGLTIGPQAGETMALIEAKHASGAQLPGYPGVHIDMHGYALVPYLTPYNLNTVEVDPKGTSMDTQLQSTSRQVAPYAGAIVKVKFDTRFGRSVMLHALQHNGKPLPFGTQVLDQEGHEVGIVGQDSRMFLSGLKDEGTLAMKWGALREEQCRIDYNLPKADKHGKPVYYTTLEASCRKTDRARTDKHEQGARTP
ncbi:outer membrane usher protein [Dyella flagellata]|uniref:Outer membrane usher protein n=1 Tax=Dyella flagellata TaxID=1867833 RepID=A0ABQ5X8H3_9GAMM|nr:outer membrane usher protein [Dyella flagellata]